MKDLKGNRKMEDIRPNDMILIAYHAHCIDGFTAAWACWRGLLATTSVLSTNIHLMEMTYGEIEDLKNHAEDYKRIYFVDFSLPIEDLEVVASKVEEIVILDHHKTAFDMYANYLDVVGGLSGFAVTVGNVRFVMDLAHCGASLTWKYFFAPCELPTLIRYVKDYDLRQLFLKATEGINKYLRLQDKNLDTWNKLASEFESDSDLQIAINTGNSVQLYHNQIAQDLIYQAEFCTIAGEEGLCVNCSPHFKDDVGSALAELSGTFGATWQQEPKGKVKWSLRSIKDYDVSALAARFNGGGHKTAASFYLKAPQEDMNNLGITLWAN